MLTKNEKRYLDKIIVNNAPYPLPTYWTKAINGLVDKGAILVHNNFARVTPEGYQMMENE